EPQKAGNHCPCSRIPQNVRLNFGRTVVARTARIPPGPSGCRIPEAQTISCKPHPRRRTCDESAFLQDCRGNVSGDVAVHTFSNRTVCKGKAASETTASSDEVLAPPLLVAWFYARRDLKPEHPRRP